MRRSVLRLAVAGVLPLALLTACGSNKSSSDASTSSKSSASASASASASKSPTPVTVPADKVSPISDVSVDTKNPKAPKITLSKKPFQVNKTTVKVLSQGNGATIGPKDTVFVDYEVVNGKDGKELVNSFDKSQVSIPLNDPQQFPGLVTALKGAKVGTTEIVAVPPADGFGGSGNAQLGVSNADTLVFYINIRSIMPKEASGKAVAPQSGFPTVTVPKDNASPATITIPKGAKAPSKTESEVLIQGSGATVKKNDSITVQYTGVLFNGGKMFDASAKHGNPATFTIGAGQVIPCWDSQLVGKTVGSRVVMMCTAADAYGAQGAPQGGIPANAPLVFVVDILHASSAS